MCRGRATPCRAWPGCRWNVVDGPVASPPGPRSSARIPPPPPLLWIWKISAWETRVGEKKPPPQPTQQIGTHGGRLCLSAGLQLVSLRVRDASLSSTWKTPLDAVAARSRPSAPASWRIKRVLPNSNFHWSPRGAIAIHSRISSSKAVSTLGESALEQALRHHTRAVVFLRQSGGNQFSFKMQHMQNAST